MSTGAARLLSPDLVAHALEHERLPADEVLEGEPTTAVLDLAAVGGVLIGAAAGWVLHRVRLRLADGALESAVGLLVPFAIYLLAEELHTSGVLAVVIAGLYLGHKADEAGYATRLQEQAVWKALDTLLEALVFALIGTLQFFNEPKILQNLAAGAIPEDFTPNMYAYQQAFSLANYNYGSAISFLMLLLNLVIALFYVRLLRERR